MVTLIELPEVRRTLLETIKRHEVRTVDELVSDIGLSKNAVRTHLLKLEAQGLIERQMLSSEHPGRPRLAFRLGVSGIEAFPKSDGELLTALLNFLSEKGHEAIIEAFFQQVWLTREREFEALLARVNNPKLEDRLSTLQAVLEKHHFLPNIEMSSVDSHSPSKTSPTVNPRSCQQTMKLSIRECNCPYPAAVRATRWPCRLESAFLGKIVGHPPSKVQIQKSPNEPCIFEWEVPSHESSK